MQKKILDIAVCPESHQPGFRIFAKEVLRNNVLLHNLTDNDIQEQDDIKSGIAVSSVSNLAYAIYDFVGIFLSLDDADAKHLSMLFDELQSDIPSFFSDSIKNTLQKIHERHSSSDGAWNREEMKYYDVEVDTGEQRSKMLTSIKEIPQWRIFLPRKKHLIDIIAAACKNQMVLEIGSGNSRTVSQMFNPAHFGYSYIGTDISFKRLIVARQAVPSGNFLQASAFNLPFRENSFKALISFGMLHHLPRPAEAIEHGLNYIVPGGYFAFHEPIIRNELPFINSALSRKLLRTYAHSERDGKIDYNASCAVLQKKKFTIIHQYKQISVFRALTESVLKNISKKIILNKQIISFLEFADRIVLHTVCLLSKRLGPNAMIVVSQKPSENAK